MVALIGTFAVFQANQRNQTQSRVALARQLGADAGSIALNEPHTAILLGLQALAQPTPTPTAHHHPPA